MRDPHFADFYAFARKFMPSYIFLAYFCRFSLIRAKINENQLEKESRAHPEELSRAATSPRTPTHERDGVLDLVITDAPGVEDLKGEGLKG